MFTNSQYMMSTDKEDWKSLFNDLVIYPFSCLAPTNGEYLQSPSTDQEGWNASFKDLNLYPFACLAPTFPTPQLNNPCQPMKITKLLMSWLKSARRQGPRSERMPLAPSRKDETEAETSTDDGCGTLFHDLLSPFNCMASKASSQVKEQAQYRLQVASKQFDTPAVLSVNEVPVPQRPCLKQILFKRRFFSFSLSRRNSKESIHPESDQSLRTCSVNDRTTQLELSGEPSNPNTQAVPRAASYNTSHIKVNFDVASTHEKASNEPQDLLMEQNSNTFATDNKTQSQEAGNNIIYGCMSLGDIGDNDVHSKVQFQCCHLMDDDKATTGKPTNNSNAILQHEPIMLDSKEAQGLGLDGQQLLQLPSSPFGITKTKCQPYNRAIQKLLSFRKKRSWKSL